MGSNDHTVAEWWDICTSVDEIRAEYLPYTMESSTVVPYFAHLGRCCIGFIQSYVAAEAGDGWWPDEHDPGVRGIDQFLADKDRLGMGLGQKWSGNLSVLIR